MASSDSQINKPQCGRPKRAELLDVNINTDAQSINTGRASALADKIKHKRALDSFFKDKQKPSYQLRFIRVNHSRD